VPNNYFTNVFGTAIPGCTFVLQPER